MRHSVLAVCVLLVFSAPALAGALDAPPAISTGPVHVNTDGPAYFEQPGAQIPGLDQTFGWLVDFHGVDLSGMSPGSEVRFGIRNGNGGESLAVAVMLDAPGPDAVSLRAVEGTLAGPLERSGHQFEPGTFTKDGFDLRLHLTSNGGGAGAWTVDPSYRAAGTTGWESFEGGSFATSEGFGGGGDAPFAGGSFYADVDQGDGTFAVDDILAVHNPEPGTILLLGAGLVGLGLYTRRRKNSKK